MAQPIYLDNQASTPVHPTVLERMKLFWETLPGNPHSSEHVVGRKVNSHLEEARSDIANLVGAFPEDVIFTSGATEANNIAILGLESYIKASGKKPILISAIEHKCVSEASRLLAERIETELMVVPVDKFGFLKLKELEKLLISGASLLSVMIVNNEIGTIQNIEKISELAAKYNVFFHCDASQAPSILDVSSLLDFVDSVSLSSHKIYGPMGVGALICNADIRNALKAIHMGGGQEQGIRSGTVPVPLCVGFAEACKLNNSNEFMTNVSAVSKLRDEFVTRVLELNSGFFLNGPNGADRHALNANICFKGFNAKLLLSLLQPSICASSGSACSSGIEDGSDVLRAIGLNTNDLNASIRFSFGIHNTQSDVDNAVNYIKKAIDNYN